MNAFSEKIARMMALKNQSYVNNYSVVIQITNSLSHIAMKLLTEPIVNQSDGQFYRPLFFKSCRLRY